MTDYRLPPTTLQLVAAWKRYREARDETEDARRALDAVQQAFFAEIEGVTRGDELERR